MDALKQKVKELSDKLAQVKKEAQEEMRDLFTPMCADVFEKFPQLESFGWTQYTDNFNDGDVCNFNVHIDPEGIYLNGVRGEGIEQPHDEEYYALCKKKSGWTDYSSSFPYTKHAPQPLTPGEETRLDELEEMNKAVLDPLDYISDMLGEFPEDILEALFDEGLVTVTRDGVTTEYYEHD